MHGTHRKLRLHKLRPSVVSDTLNISNDLWNFRRYAQVDGQMLFLMKIRNLAS